jgi:glucokinase
MYNNCNIGIDLGGTHIRGGVVMHEGVSQIISRRINGSGPVEAVLEDLYGLTDQLMSNSVTSIGIGVPGLVDTATGHVFDVVNISSWKDVPLRRFMEERYGVPVAINNDANCFALGEFHFGKGRGSHSMLGLTIGTGLGSGIIINRKLYAGRHCGAGEFGMIDYLDRCYEYYASGQFFKNVHGVDGEIVFQQAETGDSAAIKKYEEMGNHLGNVIKTILYALDVELIVIGGSVRHAWRHFNHTMWQQMETFAYRRVLKDLRIEVSELENSGILGAAALYSQDHTPSP